MAQTTGRIDGWVSDAEGGALAGVTVTADGPSLPGAQQATTDQRGAFRLLALPPGDYRLLAELDGYKPTEHPSVRVPLGGTVVLDIRLAPAFVEEITVADRAPVIDATSAKRGAELSREVIENLPVPRSSGVSSQATLEGANTLTALAPGVVPSPAGAPRVAGASHSENRYFVDGLETTGPLFTGAGIAFPFEFVEGVEIKTGSYGAEHGGALAGVLNVVTRSGGNEHRGDLFAYHREQDRQAGEFGRSPGFREVDYGVSAGGKLVRDRLWYFVAVNPQRVESELLSVQQAPLTPAWDALRFAGKLTWQATPSHRLNVSAFGRTLDQDHFDPRAVGLHGHRETFDTPGLSLTWYANSGSRLLVETGAGRFAIDHTFNTLDDSVPAYLDLTLGSWAAQQGCGDLAETSGIWFHPGCVGGDSIDDPEKGRRNQLRASATWFRGRHELKVGGSLQRVRHEGNERYPGPTSQPLVDAEGTVVDPDGLAGGIFYLAPESYTLEEFTAEGTQWADTYALFAEHRLRPTPHLTLDLGLRAEAYRSRVRETAGEPYELDFELGDMLAPRLGVVWDFARNGSSKLFAHAGRYYESAPLATSLLAFGKVTSVLHSFDYPADGSLPTYSNLGLYAGSDFIISEPQPVVLGTRPTYTDEASVGVEYELRPGLAVGLRAVHNEIGDVLENFGLGESFVLGNPAGTHTVHPITGELLPEPVTYAEPVRRYRAVELTLERPLRDRWQLFASYVYAESEGNYTRVEFEAHATSQFDFPGLGEGAFGRLPGDQPHQLKAYGSYTWPFRLVTGFVGQYYSGTPISKVGFWPNFYERFVEPRGSAGRTPATWWVDVHLDCPIRLRGDSLTLDLILDAFNVTDEQEVVAVDELWTFAEGDGVNSGECGGADPACVDEAGNPVGNPHWGQPIAFQQGRSVRFGMKLRW